MVNTPKEYRKRQYAKHLRYLKLLVDQELDLIKEDPKFEITSSIVEACNGVVKAACIYFGVVEQEKGEDNV